MAVFPADSSHDWACMNLKNRIGSADGPGTSTSVFFSGSLACPQALSCLVSFVSLLVHMALWLCLLFRCQRTHCFSLRIIFLDASD